MVNMELQAKFYKFWIVKLLLVIGDDGMWQPKADRLPHEVMFFLVGNLY